MLDIPGPASTDWALTKRKNKYHQLPTSLEIDINNFIVDHWSARAEISRIRLTNHTRTRRDTSRARYPTTSITSTLWKQISMGRGWRRVKGNIVVGTQTHVKILRNVTSIFTTDFTQCLLFKFNGPWIECFRNRTKAASTLCLTKCWFDCVDVGKGFTWSLWLRDRCQAPTQKIQDWGAMQNL